MWHRERRQAGRARTAGCAEGHAEKRPSREDEFSALKAQFRRDIEGVQPQMAYLDAIRAVLPRDGFFVEEISQVGFTSRFGFPVYAPRTFVTGGYQDNVGFGFMTALGVKIANPDKCVVSIAGDGGSCSACRNWRQRSNTASAWSQSYSITRVTATCCVTSTGSTREGIGSKLTNPDFVKLAESFGAVGYRQKRQRL